MRVMERYLEKNTAGDTRYRRDYGNKPTQLWGSVGVYARDTVASFENMAAYAEVLHARVYGEDRFVPAVTFEGHISQGPSSAGISATDYQAAWDRALSMLVERAKIVGAERAVAKSARA